MGGVPVCLSSCVGLVVGVVGGLGFEHGEDDVCCVGGRRRRGAVRWFLPWSRLVWQGSGWGSFRVATKAAWCMAFLSRLLPARLWVVALRVVPELRWVGARPA